MKNIALRFVVYIPLILITAKSFAAPAGDVSKTLVGYFSDQSQEDFDKKIKPLFDEFKGSCKTCEIVNLTPYDSKGLYQEKDVLEKLKESKSEVSFYLFSWNKRATDQNKELLQILTSKASAGQVLVAPTGHSIDGESGLPLRRTIMGQIKDIVIIGDAIERERLLPQSYFGPEMLTAIRAPKEKMGQGYSPLYFAARLAAVWGKRSGPEWLEHFRTKKLKSRKIWLDAEDLLGR